jgi:hypothetical protein
MKERHAYDCPYNLLRLVSCLSPVPTAIDLLRFVIIPALTLAAVYFYNPERERVGMDPGYEMAISYVPKTL